MANLLSWLGGAAKKVEKTVGGAVHGAEQAVQHVVQPVAQQVGQAVNNAGGQVNRAVQQSAPVIRNDAINILRGITSAANNTANFSNNNFAKPVFKGVDQGANTTAGIVKAAPKFVVNNVVKPTAQTVGGALNPVPIIHQWEGQLTGNKALVAQGQQELLKGNPIFRSGQDYSQAAQDVKAGRNPTSNLLKGTGEAVNLVSSSLPLVGFGGRQAGEGAAQAILRSGAQNAAYGGVVGGAQGAMTGDIQNVGKQALMGAGAGAVLGAGGEALGQGVAKVVKSPLVNNEVGAIGKNIRTISHNDIPRNIPDNKLKLGDVLRDDNLYSKYPELKNADLRLNNESTHIISGGVGGSYLPSGGGHRISIGKNGWDYIYDNAKIKSLEKQKQDLHTQGRLDQSNGMTEDQLTQKYLPAFNDIDNKIYDLQSPENAVGKRLNDTGKSFLIHEIEHAKQNIKGVRSTGGAYVDNNLEMGAREAQMKYGKSLSQKSKLPNNLPTIPSKGKAAPQPVSKTPQMIKRIKNSPDTPAQVADSITGSYDVRANPETMARAVQRINDNPEAALAHVQSDKYRPTVEDHTTAMLLAERARKAGNYDQMTSLLEKVAQNAHNPAQALQILSQWGKTTPEGIVKYAQKITRDAYPLPKDAAKAKLTAEQAKYFSEAMGSINKMPEGRNKLLETAKLMKQIENLAPASVGHKLQNVLYYAQLLNPKTAIRNVVGNGIFGLGENLSDTIAAPIDATKSLITGKPRAVYLPDIPGQLKAAYLGGRDAAQEAKAGVNLSGLSGQYGVANQTGTAFNNKAGRALDTAMSLELSAPDRAFYSGAEYQGLKNHLRSIGIDKKLITPENVWLAKQGMDSGLKIDNHSLEVAGELGKYRTFQDDSIPATVLQAVKSGLNLKKEFGAGSFILNYPKTPGNLLARGLDFSPVGFLKATIDLGKLATGKEVAAGAVTRDISRALVGTVGLVGTGAALNKLGIITGRPDSNKNVSAAEKTLGLGSYKINTSALRRYIFSGLNPKAAKLRPGDTLVSYDWAQPLAFSLTMGANLNETKGSSKGTVGKLSQSLGMGAGQVVDAMNSLAEQPVLQGLTKLSGGGAGVAQGVINAATSAPAGFVPTLLSQINQLTNNEARSTYSPNPIQSAIKQVENKIPGLSQNLQPQVNTIGQNAERYQNGSNTPFNVFLNPSFVSKYTPQNVLDEAKRLQDATGETKQFPDLVKYTQIVNGKNIQLTPEQITSLQTKTGQQNAKYMQDVMNTPQYKNASDTEKVNLLSNVSTYVAQAARKEVLGGMDKLSKNAQNVADGNPIDTNKSNKLKKTAKKASTKKVAKGKTSKAKGGKVAKAVKLPSYKTAKFATPHFKIGSTKKSTFAVKKLPKYGSSKTAKVKVV